MTDCPVEFTHCARISRLCLPPTYHDMSDFIKRLTSERYIDIDPEMIDWLNDNVGSNYHVEHLEVVWFKYEEDAVGFKLRWDNTEVNYE